MAEDKTQINFQTRAKDAAAGDHLYCEIVEGL